MHFQDGDQFVLLAEADDIFYGIYIVKRPFLAVGQHDPDGIGAGLGNSRKSCRELILIPVVRMVDTPHNKRAAVGTH
ncbi:hypothetical protein D3C73_1187800 [compost metagenome]